MPNGFGSEIQNLDFSTNSLGRLEGPLPKGSTTEVLLWLSFDRLPFKRAAGVAIAGG
jgi:hypothetical protein